MRTTSTHGRGAALREPPICRRRTLSGTPLEGQLRSALQKRSTSGTRNGTRRIPWQSFDPSRYPEPALRLAHDAQRMLATGEYLAVEGFCRLTTWLVEHGAPFDVIAAAAAIPADEIAHAEMAIRMAALCASKPEGEVDLEVERLRPRGNQGAVMSVEQMDVAMAQTAAIGETVAAALLSACRERAKDPVARALFSTIVADEVRHARLGWYYLAWRAPQWTLAQRARLARSIDDQVAGAEVRFARGRDAPKGAKRAAAALGVLDTPTQRETVREIMEDQIVPALDELGFDASRAWRQRRRVRS